jgi:hypothetical protein
MRSPALAFVDPLAGRGDGVQHGGVRVAVAVEESVQLEGHAATALESLGEGRPCFLGSVGGLWDT